MVWQLTAWPLTLPLPPDLCSGLMHIPWLNSIFCPTTAGDSPPQFHIHGGIQVLLYFLDAPYIAVPLVSKVAAQKLHLFP